MSEDNEYNQQDAAGNRASRNEQGRGTAYMARSASMISGAPSGKPSVKNGAKGTRVKAGSSRGQKSQKTNRASTARTGSARPQSQAARSSAAARKAGATQTRPSARTKQNKGVLATILSSKAALAAIAVVLVLVVGGVYDMASNWGKAFGNVTVNGIDVAGMTSDEIQDHLRSEYATRVSHAQVTIYANEEAQKNASAGATDEELAIAEQLAYDDAVSSVDSWLVDALSLKATVPYEQAAQEALAVGRDGGPLERIGLFFGGKDVELGVNLDGESLEALATEIDQAIGDPREDTTVVVENGVARAVEGHAGTMVDREWLADMLSRSMMRSDAPNTFVAAATPAPSRIATAEAQSMAESINRAISPGVKFDYQGRTWLASPSDVGDWTTVAVAGEEGSWHLEAGIDSSSAISAVMKGADAAITSEDMKVTFEKNGSDIWVHTSGTSSIPEVAPAVSEMNERLYGANGTAWASGAGDAVEITISESDRPESMTFDDALDLGVITVIGEYTTEFSNLEGTENRNHNIKLCADILDDAVIDANGGEWNFNERSGDTNEDAGFWSAGSIVDGEFVDSIGGGICQVATTIFNAVYEAGLDVVERHNHTIYMATYPTGRDAAVSYPDLDFIWENKLPSDILMKLSYTDTSVTAQLYSVYTGYYTTTETGTWEEGKKYSVSYEYDESLGAGSYYLKTIGEDGTSITIERTVYDKDDKVIKTDEFYSEYAPKNQVYVMGPGVDAGTIGSDGSASSGSADSSYYDYADYGYYDDTVWY